MTRPADALHRLPHSSSSLGHFAKSPLDPAQVSLVEALIATGRPTITVALRTPWDLDAYPVAGTHLCTYSILAESLAALADVLAGIALPQGRLPVTIGV